MKVTKKEVKEESVKETEKLNECVTLWLHKSKEGKKFLSGTTYGGEDRVIAFFVASKKENMPKVRVYALDEEGKATDEIVTLWEKESKSGNKYLTGITNEKENVVGFYGEETKEARPYIRVYFQNVEK